MEKFMKGFLPSPNDISEALDFEPSGFNLEDYMTSIGYPLEIHHVTTEDGYILELHRIPRGRGDGGSTGAAKPVCLFVHGLLSSSPDFLTSGPGRALPLQLADRGYDVWLGNNRGNRYSRRHTRLDPRERKFWNFSFHELGTKDLPAMIDFILNKTMQAKVTYIGHSQGNTQVLALLSTRPEYNNKFTLVNTLAPCAYMGDVTNIIFRFLGLFEKPIEALAESLGVNEVLPYRKTFGSHASALCGLDHVCRLLMFIVGGYTETLDWDYLPTLLRTFPSGSSLKAVMHIAQLVHTGEYKMYDYGRSQNRAIYGSEKPPAYNLSEVAAPVAVYVGESDNLTSLKTVDRLVSELANVVRKYLVPFKYFAHVDFLASKDINNQLFNAVIETINKYNNRS